MTVKLCECGCGQEVERRFVKGHHARGINNPMWGRSQSDTVKEKISARQKERLQESNPWIGRKHSAESRAKLASVDHSHQRTGTDRPCSECGRFYYVQKCKMEVSRFCSAQCRNQVNGRNKGPTNFLGKKHSEETKDTIRQKAVLQRSAARVSPTQPEQRVQEHLKSLGIDFETEVAVAGRFVADIFVRQYNLMLFVDGCYWHACPRHFPNKLASESDSRRERLITRAGYKVGQIWEHEVMSGDWTSLNTLLAQLKTDART